MRCTTIRSTADAVQQLIEINAAVRESM